MKIYLKHIANIIYIFVFVHSNKYKQITPYHSVLALNFITTILKNNFEATKNNFIMSIITII